MSQVRLNEQEVLAMMAEAFSETSPLTPSMRRDDIDGWDSILSILQMPNGIPVATVALNAAKNAGILAASIIGSFDAETGKKVREYKNNLANAVLDKVETLKHKGQPNYFDK